MNTFQGRLEKLLDLWELFGFVKVSSPFQLSNSILIISLGRYIIVATNSEDVGTLDGHTVSRVIGYDILPLKEYRSSDSDEEKYITLLKSHLDAATLFFSRTWDLTNSYQRQSASPSALWEKADERFFWNKYISQDLITAASTQPAVGAFIIPMIYGYAKFDHTTINGQAVTFGLLTRRSRHRAGTRYFRRGIDSKGNVANFNETEQILFLPAAEGRKATVYSYLQTRGSVPVYWAEINSLRYRPKLQVIGDPLKSAKKHFDEQTELYGRNYLVNLVNQKGYELPVKQGYENLVKQLDNPNLTYVYFDFHHECSKMRWHRVQLLIDQLVELGLDNQGWFQAKVGKDESSVESIQKSVVRTNCMDCLDRTNVVQSQLARWVLQNQLENAGVISDGHPWEQDVKFEFIFRNMWADNADAVSNAYSGTGALKTDFTRLGKRTKGGALMDLKNSITRYALNNLADGPRQDGFDLFLGNHLPYEAFQAPFYDSRPIMYQAIPYLIFGSVIMMVAASLFSKTDTPWLVGKVFTLFWVGLFTYSFKFLLDHGLQFVSWPKLSGLDFVHEVAVIKNGETIGWVMSETNKTSSKDE